MSFPKLSFFQHSTWTLLLAHAARTTPLIPRECSTPTVALISPYESPDIGWTVRGSIAFAVDVKDIAAIQQVEFFVDDESIGTDLDYPRGILWNTRNLDLGSYTLRAVATNACGGYAAVSQDVTVAAALAKAEANGGSIYDTSITLGPDDTYYLSGTGGDNDAWFHNEGINLWKSTNLKTWSYVGLIWSFERDGYPDEKAWWWYKDVRLFRAVWAPEFQYINNNFYITYSLQSKGSKLLKCTTGKPEGPYEISGGKDVILFNNIDGGLFPSATDSRSGYLCYENGNIVKLNQGWNATTGTVTRTNVGDEGCFVFHWNNKYYLSVAKFMTVGGRYSSYLGIADYPTGPYSQFHEAIPCGGHNKLPTSWTSAVYCGERFGETIGQLPGESSRQL
ncbi:glycosyl hydrolase [Aspergillus keveii]|uniref:Glycosyl hydrolase n=1 Tax=Aspergillus keveii TaxID=714993 RepID=A0ABR4FZP4_9EURO